MNIELKRVRTFQGRQGIGLNAEVWIDGKKVCFVIDEANGGMYSYQPYNEESHAGIKAMSDYAKTLPPRPLDDLCVEGEEPVTIQPDTDTLIDDAFERYEAAKFEQKKQKDMNKSIVIGNPKGSSYRMLRFKYPLSSIPKGILQREVAKAKSALKDGEVILNTNLVQLGITD